MSTTAFSPVTLLIGSHSTLAPLWHALRTSEPKANVIGCLMPPGELPTSQKPPAFLGQFSQLEKIVTERDVRRVLITLPLDQVDHVRSLGDRLDKLGVAWRFLPTLADQLAGQTDTLIHKLAAERAQPRLVDPCAIDPVRLLDRRPAPLDERAIRQTVENRVVLITGSGGSIGSELARIVCRFNPSKLVLVERAENALFEIDRDIARLFPKQKRAAVLHDVTDGPRTLAVMMAQKPDVIFHAAAHKHVPMMEEHPSAAIENNFYGTRSIADAASKVGVDRFVMISTDKAVNPTSVMGASKRLAELYIQYLNARSETTFSMVRFGNVLGSACSVLPIWAKQLANGDPITITHPDMTRYFMTIPEAAGLVIQAAAYSGSGQVQRSEFRVQSSVGQAALPSAELRTQNAELPASSGGEVFLLDMGTPIRILDLARRFIQLQGLQPDADVPIVFTGIRPGEKLYEELAYDGEDMLPTPHRSIRLWRTTPPGPQRMKQIIARFDTLRQRRDDDGHLWQHATSEEIIDALRDAVPEMRRPVESPLRQTA